MYDGQDYALNILEEQLENALESQINYIIIEPPTIGDETSKWIQVGNFLHKASVISGILGLISPLILPKRLKLYIIVPLYSVNLMCSVVYNTSWQYDPCCKYQIEQNTRKLEQLHLQNLTTSTPVVLVHRDDKYRKRLHNSISLFILGYVGWQVYKSYRS